MGRWGLVTKAADHETKLPLSARCLGLQAKHKDHKFYVHDNPVPARDKMRFWVISAQDQLKNIYSVCDGETGKGQTMILMGSLATRLPKLPHEPNLAASQRCQATLHEKNVLAGKERKMKGPNRKGLRLYNREQRPAAGLKKLKTVLLGWSMEGHNEVCTQDGHIWKESPHTSIGSWSHSTWLMKSAPSNMAYDQFCFGVWTTKSKFPIHSMVLLPATEAGLHTTGCALLYCCETVFITYAQHKCHHTRTTQMSPHTHNTNVTTHTHNTNATTHTHTTQMPSSLWHLKKWNCCMLSDLRCFWQHRVQGLANPEDQRRGLEDTSLLLIISMWALLKTQSKVKSIT